MADYGSFSTAPSGNLLSKEDLATDVMNHVTAAGIKGVYK